MVKQKYSRKKIFYVYVILDPRKPGKHRFGRWVFHYEPIYVGKGSGNRAYAHLLTSGGSKNPFKRNKIRKIRSEGLEPIVIIKRTKLTEKQALELEIRLIARIGRTNTKQGPLTNLTDGGEGTSGRKMSNLTKAKIGAANKILRLGQTVSEETRAKMCAAQKGKSLGRVATKETLAKMSTSRKTWHANNPISDETRAKLSASQKARTDIQVISDETRAKMSAAAIARYKKNLPSEEARRAKIGAFWKARHKSHPYKHSEESKARMSAVKLGKKASEETLAKMSKAQQGRTHSEESKAKMRASWEIRKNNV